MANFLLFPYLKTISGCQLAFSRSDFLYTGQFLAKKNMAYSMMKNLFRFRFFFFFFFKEKTAYEMLW